MVECKQHPLCYPRRRNQWCNVRGKRRWSAYSLAWEPGDPEVPAELQREMQGEGVPSCRNSVLLGSCFKLDMRGSSNTSSYTATQRCRCCDWNCFFLTFSPCMSFSSPGSNILSVNMPGEMASSRDTILAVTVSSSSTFDTTSLQNM